jgi:hypothetical protein
LAPLRLMLSGLPVAGVVPLRNERPKSWLSAPTKKSSCCGYEVAKIH